MRKSTQALLWSAAIFPGAGHLFLKYFQRGIALIAISLISLSLLLIQIVQYASQVIEKALAEGSSLDLQYLVATTMQASADDKILNAALWALILCWVLGMVDAYLLGKKLER